MTMPMSVRKAEAIATDKNREITSAMNPGDKGKGKAQDVGGGNMLQRSTKKAKAQPTKKP